MINQKPLLLICLISLLCSACPDGKYQTTAGGGCSNNCMSSCTTCSDGTTCDSCSGTNKYLSLPSKICTNCPTGCVGCNSTSCTSCLTGYYLSTICILCPTQCSQCSTSTNCSACNSGYYLSGSSCLSCTLPSIYCGSPCSCTAGYYLSGSCCYPCQAPCAQCSGSATNCTTCVDPTNQTTPTCNCNLPTKYLDNLNNYNCSNCVSPCLNCSSQSSCNSCINTYYLQGTSCYPCTSPCVNCATSSTNCTSCIDSTNQTTPSCQCQSGYLMNTSTHMCMACTYPCTTCQNFINECYSCASTYNYDSSTHTCTCSTNQYLNNLTPQTCQNCLSPCLTCSNNTDCNTCIAGLNRHLSGQSCICNDGYYDNSGVCTQCSLPCIKCTSATFCTQCNDSSHQVLNDCHCIDTYYMDALYVCQLCTSPCVNCSSASVCTSCINNYYLSAPNCNQCSLPCQNCIDTNTKCTSCAHTHQTVVSNQCVCDDGYYMDNFYYCQLCAHPCSKCTNSSTYCTDCVSTFTSSGLNTCICSDGYYENTNVSPSSCQICTQPCNKCTISSTHCVTCIDAHQTVDATTFQCLCNIGWVANGNYCDQCLSPCTECSSSTSYCTACKDAHHQVTSGSCICETGWLNDANYDCQPCISPCTSCSVNTSHCDTCSDPYHTINASYQCVCQNTYYSDTISHCASCIQPCANCNSTGCLTCIDVNQYVDSNSDCVCNNGYYMDSVNCTACQLPCVHCTSSLDCLTCIDTNQTLINDRCICNDGYYSNGNYCSLCQVPCTKCITNQDTCTQCIDPNHLVINNKCICKPGYGSSGLNGNYCSVCQYPCLECSVTVYSCTKCVDYNLFQLESNQCICQLGYYMQNNQCLRCAPQCKSCEYYDDNCLICKDPTFIQIGNTCICDYGYYLDSSFQCKKCDNSCSSCAYNNNFCTSCVKEYQNLINHTCICQDGYYMLNDSCFQCQTICSKCSSNVICTECIDGYFLNGSICQKCLQQCETCTSQDICLSCSVGYTLNSLNNCIACMDNCLQCSDEFSCDICKDGYYYGSMLCNKCSNNCKTCSVQIDFCLSCNNNYNLDNNQCICGLGYYEQDYNCYKCQYPCVECLDKNTCQQCAQIQNLSMSNEKTCICQDGFYWSITQCSICNSTCLTCQETSTKCLSCDLSLNKILQNNQCICAPNYFLSDLNTCNSCDSEQGKLIQSCKYKNCLDLVWTYGEECDDGNQVSGDGCSSCKIDSNYVCANTIMQQSICYQCPLYCISCQYNQNTSQSQCINCKSGYYLTQNQCQPCDNQCKECESNPQNCISCRFVQLQSTKCEICESRKGYHSDYSTDTCYTKCGDSILADSEQCDDGNLINGDGCNNKCFIENNFSCQNNECIIPNYPIPTLSSIGNPTIYDNIRLFKLEYNLPLNISNSSFNIASHITLYIEQRQGDIQQLYYQNIITENMTLFENNYFTYYATIKLLLNETTQNQILNIYFLDPSKIQSYQGYSQKIDHVKALIQDYIFVDKATQNLTETFNSFSINLFYIFIILLAVSILLGGLDIFYNLLDTIQLLSYLKYINLQFPYNLKSYFDIFGFAQLSFIQNSLNIEEFIQNFISQEEIKSPPKKIADDNYSSLYLVNIFQILAVYATLFGTYALALIIPIILKQFRFKYYEDYPEKDNLALKIKIYFLSFKIFMGEICSTIVNQLFYSGILRTFMATAYDYSFIALLQINCINLNSNSVLLSFSSFIAVFAILLYFIICLVINYLIGKHSLTLIQSQNKNRFGSLLEGVKLKNYYQKCFNVALLIKKFMFMVILIFCYEDPLSQTLNLFLLSVLMVLYLFHLKPVEDQNEYNKQLSTEVILCLTYLFIVALIVNDQIRKLNFQEQMYIGWICIVLITSIILIQLIIDIIQQWKILLKNFATIRRFIKKISQLFNKKPEQAHCKNIFEEVQNHEFYQSIILYK